MRRVLLLACAVFATSCLNINPAQPNVPLGSPFTLKVGHSAVVPGGLSITFDTVLSDSRCPIDAICVTAGEARVAMTLSTGSRNRVQREWRTNPTNDRVSFDDFSIELRELHPYPSGGTTIAPGDYVATIAVFER
jgi:hypothetical protein